ncbi:MAG: heavy metal-binding domain-containing protein [Gammaproteobacteria bacterium]|nr:heavy metal-binding domain-containing protein [Gammaproteobacteria bacterium]
MIITTTNVVDGSNIKSYLGIVSGEAILGANIFRDLFATVRDIVGGRSAAYEKELARARNMAMDDLANQAENLNADAVVGVDIDYETVGKSMLMVSVTGTAVTLVRDRS